MKKFIYFFFIIMVCSCAGERKEKYHESNISLDKVSLETSNKGATLNEFKYELIAKQKLQDYIELMALKKEHPELRIDIEKQLKSLSNDTLRGINIGTSITNIHQIGGVETVSDNVQKIKLKYLLFSSDKWEEHFVYAYINFSTIIVDGKKIRANKVSFSVK